MRRRMIKENPKRHTKKQNRETRRNKKAESKGEKGQHTHTVTRIIFETVFVPANKGKTRIHSKNITINRLFIIVSFVISGAAGKLKYTGTESKGNKGKPKKEKSRGCSRPAKASPPSPSPRRLGKQALLFNSASFTLICTVLLSPAGLAGL
jgi:hypothetical protein